MSQRDQDPQAVLRRWFASAHAEGGTDSVLQKRGAARTSWTMPIEIHYGTRNSTYGRVRDVNENGVGIQCRTAIAEWTEVRIQLQDQPDEYVDGVVVHCTETVGGYKIGVRIEPSKVRSTAGSTQQRPNRHPWPQP